jgi:hypothetical protein
MVNFIVDSSLVNAVHAGSQAGKSPVEIRGDAGSPHCQKAYGYAIDGPPAKRSITLSNFVQRSVMQGNLIARS